MSAMSDPPAGPDLRAAAVHGVRWTAMARGTVELVLLASMVLLARLISPAEFGYFAVAIIAQELAIRHPDKVRSLTQGRASWTMEPSGYAPVSDEALGQMLNPDNF